ncbi:MAG: nucleoside phosphorylase [Atribacterota bacterium]
MGNYFISPIYELAKNNKKIGIINHPFGAPTAGAVIEELADNGCRKIIACGTAGVLDKKISKGEIVIPNEAVRDEGTSYHYIKPDEKAVPHPKAVDTVIKTCQKNKLSFRTGKTWTTDAIFRETKNIIAKRKNKGCVTVEMEGAAFFAASKLKNIMTAQILYALDDISGPKWNKRTKLKPRITMEKVFWLAVESCFKL